MVARHVVHGPIAEHPPLLCDEGAQRVLVLARRRMEAVAAAHRVACVHGERAALAREATQLPQQLRKHGRAICHQQAVAHGRLVGRGDKALPRLRVGARPE
eukprot:245355-Prymnesium_polylepis.1